MFGHAHSENFDANEYTQYEGDPVARRQYTVKGIESETVDLMRDAASKEGMKIGAWVSTRMKEAAIRSLNGTYVRQIKETETKTSVNSDPFESLLAVFLAYKEDSERKLRAIEQELHAITSSQRTIMEKMLRSIDS